MDVVLLGAGASVEAGVPASFAMTQRLVAAINESRPRPTAQALNFICGALVGHDSAGGADPFTGLDIERVFAAVKLLAERRTLEVTPFVANWHPAVDAWDRPIRPLPSRARLSSRALSGFSERGTDYEAVAQLIDDRLKGGSGHAYDNLADAMIGELRALVQTTFKSLDYLQPLVRQGARPGGLTIATLNYDLSIEHAAQQAGVPVSCEPPARPNPALLKVPGIRLLKLHGSIDWEWHREPQPGTGMEQHSVRRRNPDARGTARSRPALVFGARGKLQAEGPFLTLLALFEEALSWASRLIVIGYSFRDLHINEMIRRWTATPGEMIIVDPGLPEDGRFGRDFRGEMIGTLNPRALNDGQQVPPRVRLMRVGAGDAIAELFQD